jgi:hypothetical protein
VLNRAKSIHFHVPRSAGITDTQNLLINTRKRAGDRGRSGPGQVYHFFSNFFWEILGAGAESLFLDHPPRPRAEVYRGGGGGLPVPRGRSQAAAAPRNPGPSQRTIGSGQAGSCRWRRSHYSRLDASSTIRSLVTDRPTAVGRVFSESKTGGYGIGLPLTLPASPLCRALLGCRSGCLRGAGHAFRFRHGLQTAFTANLPALAS